jgi:Rrf2 family transcriptional regulator, iron-sulfur cluster assembly transcription factor
MLFSRSAEYAIRAMTFLALLPPGRLAGAREIAEVEKIPTAFLWKILQTLARRRLIRSFKGVRGGYELAHAADRISLNMIVEATDSTAKVERCVLGLPSCSDANACPLHDTWKDVRNQMLDMLHRNTLADLVSVVRQRARID